MKPLLVANWKMNPSSVKEAEILFDSVQREIKKMAVDLVVCPPLVYLEKFQYPTGNVHLGAQNMFYEESGAFTGEISSLMLKSLGVAYVILGHSERRHYFGETDEIINRKVREALRSRIKPIFCVGERTRLAFEGEDDSFEQEIEKQILIGLKDVSATRLADLVIAYEPVWAIGSGKPATPDNVFEVSLLIRKILSKMYGRTMAQRVKIIYGGSVTSRNARSFTVEAKTDGLLVGGASLNATEFVGLAKSLLLV